MKMTEVTLVEVEAIAGLIMNMHRLAFKESALTRGDQRDLQNLLDLLQDRIRKQAFVLEHLQMEENK